MKKTLYTLLLLPTLSLAPRLALAQDPAPNRAPLPPTTYKISTEVDTTQGWRRGGVGTFNFSQVSLRNWAPGGQSSLSLLAIGNSFAHYRGPEHTFDFAADVVYGLLKPGKARVRKNDDRLELNARYGHFLTNKLSWAAQLNLKTQLTPTTDLVRTDSLLSRFFAPAYILASLGIDYRPNTDFSLFLSPITGKFTVVGDRTLADAGAFGVKAARRDAQGRPVAGTGERLREEIGAYLNGRYRKPVLTNITYQTKLELFSNYFHNPQNIDVNWENLIDFKVNKFVSASVATVLVYDDDILVPVDRNEDGVPDSRGRRVQFKETLGIGLTYKF
ncbi:DUF3078 domain-containing protein [Hymenobacter busanensis]|uniref:DUF3078 domain-containing protein n=1 Tax=Hymenobacter busanensis TaxID=2607656 RepID=A0A7L4ZY70_9BACT|nr:DUF3078 domain-containing protein [Hymenobacter busanensis]KAA9325543.1 DUF3078 domain-containing protein [Hymenobacter busanensis]QHJ07786.1 DUF3078 domain-containing protein [Hymenobacter busanensis]